MGQSYCSLHYHVVFSTKGRRPWLTDDLWPRLSAYFQGAIAKEKGVLLFGGAVQDHVHMLVGLHQNVAIANFLRAIKANSSGWVHDTFREMRSFAWQRGYGAFTVSQSQLNRVRRYIERQPEHHRTQTFQEGFIALLKAHGIKYDERYLWD